MNTEAEIALDFEIDKLTNSIENVISGEVFDTQILQIMAPKQIRKTDWTFKWHSVLKDKSKTVFQLNTINNPDIIQGLICLTDKSDHIFMDLIESAKFNKPRLRNGLFVRRRSVSSSIPEPFKPSSSF